MPWCPKCKTEYIEGIEKCADCHTPLVPTWEDCEVAADNTVDDILVTEEPEGEMLEDEMPEDEIPEEILRAAQTVRERPTAYVKTEDKYSDTKSSGYMLTIIGAAGIIALVLIAADIIHFSMDPVMQYVFYIVLGVLFVVFLVLGINALRRSGEYKAQIAAEKDRTSELLEWLSLDEQRACMEASFNDDMTEEEKYFECQSVMQKLLKERDPEISESYADYIIELAYQKIFE